MTPTTDSGQTNGGASTPPLSTVPPPTMARPTGPPTSPSDQLTPVTLVGSAVRVAAGCVVLTTAEGVRYELAGDLAGDALAHAQVKVHAMPTPNATSSCDLPVMAVRSVTAFS